MAGMTWEERMAAATAARRAAEPAAPDPHRGHHVHYLGNRVICSCGSHMGIFSIALVGDERPVTRRCPDCGQLETALDPS
jgi:hypothetical protein